jgi:response regulator of citrate/malate metabolism
MASNNSAELKNEVKVLVIDDSLLTRKKVVSYLQNTPYRISGEAGSFQEATHVLATSETNVILLDTIMPDVNGIELTRHLRENFNKIDVILMLPLLTENFVFDAITSGAFDFLLKPLKKDLLLSSLMRIHRIINNED